MTYIEWLKEHENYDKFILFLLSIHSGDVALTAEDGQITRQHVYNVIKRNRSVIEDYFRAVKQVVKEDNDA